MSIPLPLVDMSVYAMGASGTVSFQNAGPTASLNQYKSPAHVQIFNESGSGLQISFLQSGAGYFIPAGGWVTIPLTPGESGYSFNVVYKLSNPSVQQLSTVWYAPGEHVPDIPSLGNSPVGGGVTSSGAQNLTNTGNAPLTNIINVQPSDAASATWTGDNSGNLSIKGDNAGVLTTLLQLIAGASPAVKLAAASVLVECLGNLQVDGGTATLVNGSNTATMSVDASGNFNHTASGASGSIKLGNNGTAANVMDAIAGGSTYIKSGASVIIQVPNGTSVVTLTGGGITFNAGGLKFTNNQTLAQVGTFTGTTTGTYNHPINGAPDMVIPMTNTSGSQTMGFDTVTSTQVHITSFSGLSFKAYCLKG